MDNQKPTKSEEERLASMFDLADKIGKYGSVGNYEPKCVPAFTPPVPAPCQFDEMRLLYLYGL